MLATKLSHYKCYRKLTLSRYCQKQEHNDWCKEFKEEEVVDDLPRGLPSMSSNEKTSTR